MHAANERRRNRRAGRNSIEVNDVYQSMTVLCVCVCVWHRACAGARWRCMAAYAVADQQLNSPAVLLRTSQEYAARRDISEGHMLYVHNVRPAQGAIDMDPARVTNNQPELFMPFAVTHGTAV